MQIKQDASSARDLIQIRCQQGEKASWQQEAKENGLSLGDYVRLKMARKTRKHIPKTDPELIRQLAAIGNNINQLARAVNTTDMTDIHLLTLLVSCERALSEIAANASN